MKCLKKTIARGLEKLNKDLGRPGKDERACAAGQDCDVIGVAEEDSKEGRVSVASGEYVLWGYGAHSTQGSSAFVAGEHIRKGELVGHKKDLLVALADKVRRA